MIPKTIHYCWFGGKPLSKQTNKCIQSWRKYFPDYEIKEWNESNFDVNIITYTAEAYNEKKYAFVSDYARLWIMYYYGGIYFDTDVEVIKNMDEIISRGPYMGCEEEGVNPGLGVAASPGLGIYKELLDSYSKRHFINADGSLCLNTIVQYTTEILTLKGFQNTNIIQRIDGVYIYPKQYFCPKNYQTGKIAITSDTKTIHHYTASWVTNSKLYTTIERVFGKAMCNWLISLKIKLLRIRQC